MKKNFKLIKFTIFIFLILFNNSNAEKTDKIILLVGNEVITNYDVVLEIKYLNLISNGTFGSANNKENIKTAKQYLIKDRIKVNEIEKFPSIVVRDEQIEFQVDQIARNLGFGTPETMEEFLIQEGYSIEDLEKKIATELKWNQLVYQFYSNSIVIDKAKIENKLKTIISKQKMEEFQLYEIFLEGSDKEDLNRKFAVVVDNIKKEGFENTAIKFSSSPSSQRGGKLGWIGENKISPKLLQSIQKAKAGDVTDPIQIPGGIILLYVEDKRVVELNINTEKELQRLIEIEKNKQLDQFSITYFNQVKNNTAIKSFE